MAGIHRNYLDFEILETGNLNTLVFVDSSQYINPPESPLLEIYLPGMDKYLLANVISSQVNTFNSNTLGYNAALGLSELQDLPDGIWTLRYKVCPYMANVVEKQIMRVTLLKQKLKVLYNEIAIGDCHCPTERDAYVQRTLTQINILIRSSVAVADINPTKAQNDYRTANDLVDDLTKRFCKNCRF